MQVTFLGTGTSQGIPMIGCTCAVCRSTDPHDKRFRASIVVTQDDGTQVLVDTTPDLRSQALTWGLTRVDAVVYTHSHADHIFGLDELRRFIALRGGGTMGIHGDAHTIDDIHRIFDYAFSSPPEMGGGVPRLVSSVIDGPFQVAGTRWTPIPILHGRRTIFGYRIGDFAYLTDCSRVPDETWPLLDGVEVLVIGALRDRPHPTHLSLPEAMEVAGRVGARQTYFTHMCHDLGHATTNARLPEGMALAYDGLSVSLPAAASS
ncbi:MAG TPA: MBL fold metallo-hydrolase [Luteitalea sp.]|nr:MBL fold metallo-hydrolase [Luteitalea sp.]